MVNKPGSSNPMQKGTRRQKLHENQNIVGNPKKSSGYEDFNGNPIE